MKAFMDENFLLDTDTARTLFFEAARDLPIIDYHCHLSPREIWQNQPFENRQPALSLEPYGAQAVFWF